jgi:hypothetical protein
MKVLIFSPEKPYTGAESLVTGKLMRAMLNKGWEVDMVFHDTELIYKSDTDTLNILNNCFGIKNTFFEKNTNFIKKVPILKKIYLFDSLFWILKSFILAIKLNRVKNYDLVLSRVMPQYGHLPALMFSAVCKKKWIANWSDPLPIQKSPAPYGQGPNAKVSSLQMFYLGLIVKKATFNSFPSDRLLNYYYQYLPKLQGRSFVLPHVVFNDENQSVENNEINVNLNSFVITHVGGLGLRNPTNFIYALNELYITKEINIDIKIRFIGFVETSISSLIEELKLDHLFSLEGLKLYEYTLNAIKESDMMLVVEAPLEEGIFFPSKVTDYVQFNKPIFAVSPAVGIMNDVLETYGGGICADCTSVDSIKFSLLKIMNEYKKIKNCEGLYNTSNLRSKLSEDEIVKKIQNICVC